MDKVSDIRSKPPPEVPVITFEPANEAPRDIEAAAISFSAWKTMISLFGSRCSVVAGI